MGFLRKSPQAAAPVVDPTQMPGPPSQDEAGAANALQAILGGGQTAPAPQPAPVSPVTPTNFFQSGGNTNAAPAPAPAAPRRSILDTVGRLADVFASVGGASPLYQPTLDARENRQITLGDHARAVTLENQKIQSGQMDNTTQAGKIVGQALRGVQALKAANPNADISQIWPALAQQAGVDPEHAAAIGNTLASNPDALDALASTLNDDGKEKYSGSIIYGKDKDGNLRAYQANTSGGQSRQVKLDDGFSPVDPAKAVDLGGSTALVGTRGGTVQRILPKTERPGAAADRASRERIAGDNIASRERIAVLPARGKAGAKGGEDAQTGATAALTMLGDIEKGFDKLHEMKALAGDDGGVVNNVLGALTRGTSVGQSIAEQAGSPSAQMRLQIAKNVSSLQSEMIKSLPASATRTKFEQEIQAKRLPDPSKMDYATAKTVIGQLRQSYIAALGAPDVKAAGGATALPGAKRPAAAAPAPRRIAPAAPARRPAPARGPSVTNW